MSNPRLDGGAETIAAMRQQPDLAALEPVEKHLIAALDQVAPELDKAAVGAAWMILAEGLAQLANDAPQHFTPRVLVNVSQLAGQRLYAGAATGMQTRCPIVRSAGSQCPFVAKGATEDRMDAMMQTHYATYHPGQTWPPAAEELAACIDCEQEGGPFFRVDSAPLCPRCALRRGAVSINEVRAAFGYPPFDDEAANTAHPLGPKYPDDLAGALRVLEAERGEREPYVTVHANHFDSATGERIPAKVTLTPVGEPLIDGQCACGAPAALAVGYYGESGPVFQCVRCATADPRTPFSHRKLADAARPAPLLPTYAIGRCKVCSWPVGIDEGSGLPAGYVTERGVMCREHRDEAYPSDAVPAAAGVMATEALVDGGIRYESAKCPECRFLIYLKDGVFVSHTRGGSFFECAGSGRRPASVDGDAQP